MLEADNRVDKYEIEEQTDMNPTVIYQHNLWSKTKEKQLPVICLNTLIKKENRKTDPFKNRKINWIGRGAVFLT